MHDPELPHPAHHLPNSSTTTSICDRPESCTEVQEIATSTAALLVNLSLITQQHRPDSTLSCVSGCGGVRVACGIGAVITGADVLR